MTARLAPHVPLLIGVLLTAVVAACGSAPGPTIPATVSQDVAVTAAKASVSSSTPIAVDSVALSTFGKEAPDSQLEAASLSVWAVRLSGTFEVPSCGPAGATVCPSPLGSALVLIDASTGEFILASMPAPQPAPAAS